MYFLDAIAYPFSGRKTLGKLIIGLLLTVIPIVNIFGTFALAGYYLRMVDSIMNHQRDLPEWYDFGSLLSRGFLLVIGYIVYWLITIILTITIIGIPIAVFVPAAAVYASTRYARTGRFADLIDIGGNMGMVFRNFGASMLFYINAFLFGFFISLIAIWGLAFLIVPGILCAMAAQYSNAYLSARYALQMEKLSEPNQDMFMGKAKNVPQDTYNQFQPQTQPQIAASLVFLSGDFNGQEVPIMSDYFVIGRGQESDLVIEDSRVSRQHTVIENRDGQFFVINQGQMGTRLNGNPVEEQMLNDRDALLIGDVALGFKLG